MPYLIWLLVGLAATILVDLLAYKGKVYCGYPSSAWVFKGVTPRFIFAQTIFILTMPLTVILLVVGIVWLLTASEFAKKPLCKCVPKKKSQNKSNWNQF